VATVNSNQSKILVNSVDLTCFVDSIDGLPPDMGTDDVTTLCGTGRQHAATLTDGTFTIGGPYDSTPTTGPDAVLAPLQASGAVVPFVYGPAGSATGARKFSGNCIITQYKPVSKAGSVVRYTAVGQVTGNVTTGVY
jgi:hypothetical protein